DLRVGLNIFLGHFGHDIRWSDAVNANIESSPLHRKSFGELNHSSLTGYIRSEVHETSQAKDGGIINDAAALPLYHLAANCARAQKISLQICINDAIPLFFGQIHKGLHDINTSVIDQNVDLTKARDSLIGHGLNVFCSQ